MTWPGLRQLPRGQIANGSHQSYFGCPARIFNTRAAPYPIGHLHLILVRFSVRSSGIAARSGQPHQAAFAC